ncbi:amino acid ABC transporter permease [Clostridium sardiniense]|uniref:amino acid ABC transporter permease n=1 Tax=Clostridium sardiniense TaxID=29369 RepID=UPI00195AC170|nr:amino acid ABC transporter permease [Clostridium sardiniense]MBM7832991.1 polar amino acid transport system permease protein/polar amino acid transport system substrate-binding protein [Clostridium sardiniense]
MGYQFDFSFLPQYFPVFLDGAKMTLIISLISVCFGTAFGSVLYFMKTVNFKIGKLKPLLWIATIYIEIVRGTPMILQILMVYSGSALFFGWDFSPLTAAVVAISLNSAAYVSEIIRAGIDAVDKGQMEAARSLGMTKVQSMKMVVLPQAVKNIMPAVGNEFVAVIKESSMASFIGVGELMFSADIVKGSVYLVFEPLMVIGVLYFIMTFSLGRLMAYFERRLKASDIR